MKGLFLFSIFTIIYGSLFPFEFQYVNWEMEGQDILLSTVFFGGRLGDSLGNVFLFIPLGFAGSALISRHNIDKKFYVGLYGLGFALAIAIQAAQVYLPARVPALHDAIWNLVGIFAGDFFVRVLKTRYPGLLKSDQRLALLALLSCWIIFLLVPFIFNYDAEELRKNIEYHIDINQYRFANILLFTFLWVTYASLIEEILPNRRNFLFSLEFAVFFTTIAKIFVYRNEIESELFLCGIIAIFITRSGIFRKLPPYKFTALILLFTMFYNSLYPFEFYDNPFKEFKWIPFSELFSDDMLAVVRTVFYKTFIYGAIVWNLYKGFPNLKYVSLFCILYASVIEYFQYKTLMRVGGLTEPLIVLFLCTFIEQKNVAAKRFKNESKAS